MNLARVRRLCGVRTWLAGFDGTSLLPASVHVEATCYMAPMPAGSPLCCKWPSRRQRTVEAEAQAVQSWTVTGEAPWSAFPVGRWRRSCA